VSKDSLSLTLVVRLAAPEVEAPIVDARGGHDASVGVYGAEFSDAVALPVEGREARLDGRHLELLLLAEDAVKRMLEKVRLEILTQAIEGARIERRAPAKVTH
jgi:hypothetical protein